MHRFVIVALVVFLSANADADEARRGPIIKLSGTAFSAPNRTVPLENVEIAIVYANAAKVALNNAEYRANCGVEIPNHDQITELANTGVQCYACGQSMG